MLDGMDHVRKAIAEVMKQRPPEVRLKRPEFGSSIPDLLAMPWPFLDLRHTADNDNRRKYPEGLPW